MRLLETGVRDRECVQHLTANTYILFHWTTAHQFFQPIPPPSSPPTHPPLFVSIPYDNHKEFHDFFSMDF